MKTSNSQKLLSQYLNGSAKVSMKDIEKQEFKELFSYYLKKFSFNKPWLTIAVLPLAVIAIVFADSNN